MYKAVIFDLGKVVFDLSFDRVFQSWANASNGRYDAIKDKFSFDLDTYRGIDNLLAKLQQRYQLVALTNTNSIHSAVWKMKYAGTLHYFQKVFSSHELKERKPNARAYQIVLDYLQIEPPQAVFLDDNIDNVKGADQLGIKAILVTSFDQMAAELQVIGLLN